VRCPQCGADLTEEVSLVAGDWSEGLPEEVGVWCEECEAETEFRVEWHCVLWSVTPKERGVRCEGVFGNGADAILRDRRGVDSG
jgi:hypothetical protein